MRIGIDVRGLVGPRTGLGWYTHAIVGNLLSQRPEHDFVLISDKPFPEMERWHGFGKIALAGGWLHPTPVRAWWDKYVYGRVLERHGCEVAFSPLSAVPNSSRVPAVATVHDLAFFKYKEIMPYRYRRYWTGAMQRAVARARRIIADSQATRQDLIYYCGADPEKIDVVHLAVDPFFTQPVRMEDSERVLGEHGIEPGYLLFVGTSEPRKNLGALLDAYAMLPADLKHAHPLVLAGGEGWGAGALKKKEHELVPHLYRLGYVDQATLRILYRHAACFLFPSLYEGFGLPVLEAMACGTPVITSAVASLPEVAGGAAEFVDPHSPKDLARAIERVLTDPQRRAALIRDGHKQVQRFSWDDAARSTWMVLDRAAQEK